MRIATMLVFRSRAFSWRAHAQCSAKRPPYCARRPQRARRYADKPQLARSADLHHADYAGNLVSRRQTTQRNQLVFTVPTPRSSQAYCTPLPQELQPGAKMNPEVFENCSAILIDIAGTVGSINFTKVMLTLLFHCSFFPESTWGVFPRCTLIDLRGVCVFDWFRVAQ